MCYFVDDGSDSWFSCILSCPVVVYYLTSCPAWGWRAWLWHWRHGSAAKLLKTQVHSCPNSSCHCLAWPWSTVSVALTYRSLQVLTSTLALSLTTNHNLLNPLFCPLLLVPCSELYWFWTTTQWPEPEQMPFIIVGVASWLHIYNPSGPNQTAEMDHTLCNSPKEGP